MNNNLEFANEDPSPDSIEDNHPRTNYGEGYGTKETLEEVKDLNYWKNNCEENYITTPISVLRYISELEKQQERSYSEKDVKQAYLDGCKIKLTNIYHLKKWFEQFKKK